MQFALLSGTISAPYYTSLKWYYQAGAIQFKTVPHQVSLWHFHFHFSYVVYVLWTALFFSLFCCYKTIIVLVTFKLICSVFIQPEIKHAAHVPACHNIQECVFFSEKEMPSSCRYLNTCNVNFGSRGQGSKVHLKKKQHSCLLCRAIQYSKN